VRAQSAVRSLRPASTVAATGARASVTADVQRPAFVTGKTRAPIRNVLPSCAPTFTAVASSKTGALCRLTAQQFRNAAFVGTHKDNRDKERLRRRFDAYFRESARGEFGAVALRARGLITKAIRCFRPGSGDAGRGFVELGQPLCSLSGGGGSTRELVETRTFTTRSTRCSRCARRTNFRDNKLRVLREVQLVPAQAGAKLR
jgi:hypothetical protein